MHTESVELAAPLTYVRGYGSCSIPVSVKRSRIRYCQQLQKRYRDGRGRVKPCGNPREQRTIPPTPVSLRATAPVEMTKGNCSGVSLWLRWLEGHGHTVSSHRCLWAICNANGGTFDYWGCMAVSETKPPLALAMTTMGMAAATSMAARMTAGVPSEQAVAAAEVCLVRTSAKALRGMSTAKQVKAA
jgi:hypothetical protein